MKNKFLIFLYFATAFFSCLGDPYDIEFDQDFDRRPLYYCFIGSNDAQIYYDTVSKITDTFSLNILNSSFKKLNKGSLVIGDKNVAIDTTYVDKYFRVFNTPKSLKVKTGETVEFHTDKMLGQCIMPDSIDLTFAIDSIVEVQNGYEFYSKLMIKKVTDANLISGELEVYYDGEYVSTSPLPLDSNFNIESVESGTFSNIDWFFYNPERLQTNKVLPFYFTSSRIRTTKNPKVLPAGIKKEGRLELVLKFKSYDDNFVKYVELEDKNATGVENPLATYADSYNNLKGAYGFIGCYATSTIRFRY